MRVQSETLHTERPDRMTTGASRRALLKWGGAALLSCAGWPDPRPARAAGLEMPILDGVSLSVVTDASACQGSAIRKLTELTIEEFGSRPGHLEHAGNGLIPDNRFSLVVRSFRRGDMRNVLFDYGCPRDTLLANMERLRLDPAALDQIVSIADEREPIKLPLTSGRWSDAVLVGDHGFASPTPAAGADKAAAVTTAITGAMAVPAQCSAHLAGFTVSFVLVCRGLIVVTSAGPRGLVDAVRQAQTASGIDKVHAVVVGADMSSGTDPDVLGQAAAGLRGIDLDHVVLGYCSGQAFYDAANSALPGRVIRTSAGMRLTFVL